MHFTAEPCRYPVTVYHKTGQNRGAGLGWTRWRFSSLSFRLILSSFILMCPILDCGAAAAPLKTPGVVGAHSIRTALVACEAMDGGRKLRVAHDNGWKLRSDSRTVIRNSAADERGGLCPDRVRLVGNGSTP
ncbi:hypothetical protein NDU88_006539 [Pleurodeles waltl]|uniref:Secreted protein n=1 Tax=Pleurodeles waltl TaxID=8319 RepID=A0AAV7SPY8_PLEWA|nr:hypothetical protein NDU88_006539 [Pleurodeles waltl]